MKKSKKKKQMPQEAIEGIVVCNTNGRVLTVSNPALSPLLDNILRDARRLLYRKSELRPRGSYSYDLIAYPRPKRKSTLVAKADGATVTIPFDVYIDLCQRALMNDDQYLAKQFRIRRGQYPRESKEDSYSALFKDINKVDMGTSRKIVKNEKGKERLDVTEKILPRRITMTNLGSLKNAVRRGNRKTS